MKSYEGTSRTMLAAITMALGIAILASYLTATCQRGQGAPLPTQTAVADTAHADTASVDSAGHRGRAKKSMDEPRQSRRRKAPKEKAPAQPPKSRDYYNERVDGDSPA